MSSSQSKCAAVSCRWTLRRLCVPLAVCLVAALASSTAYGQTIRTWSGTTDNNWVTTTNWSGGTAAGASSGTTSTDYALFNTNATNRAPTWSSYLNLAGFTFDTANVGSFTIGSASGSAAFLTNSGTTQLTATVTAAQTINAPLVILNASGGSSGTYTFLNSSTTAAATLTLGGAISGQATAGNTTAITFTPNVASSGISVSGVISDGTGGGRVAVVKSGTGTLSLSGVNTYSGTTTINAGTLRFAQAASLYSGSSASWTAGNIIVNSGATLALNVGGSGEFSTGNVTTILTNLGGLGGAVTNNGLRSGAFIGFDTSNAAGGTFTVANNIANSTGSGGGAIGVTKLGANTLVLSGTNTYTGATTINAGVLVLGGPSALPANSALTVGSASGGTLDLNGNNVTASSLAVGNAAGTITDNSAVSGTTMFTSRGLSAGFASTITDGANGRVVAVTLQNIGNSSNNFFTNANTFSGGLTLSGTAGVQTRLYYSGSGVGTPGNITSSPIGRGTLTIGSGTADQAQLYISANNSTVLNNVAFNSTQGTDFTTAVRLNASGIVFSGVLTAGLADINFGNGNTNGTATLTGQLTGANGLWLKNAGLTTPTITVTLQNATGAANNYQGNTTIDARHSLILGAANQIPSGVGYGGMSLFGTFNLGGYSTPLNWLSGTGVVEAGGGTPLLTIGATGVTGTFAGRLINSSGTLSLTKSGSGTLTLSSANTYTGITTINGGVLSVSSLANGGVASNIGQSTNAAANLVLGGGTMQYTGVSGTTDRSFTLTAATASGIDIPTEGTTLTLTGAAASTSGALTKSGSGTLVLAGANAYTGATTINSGILQVGNGGSAGSIASTASISIASDATLVFNRSDNYGGSVGSTISGSGALALLSGSLTLTKANTYTGQTTVSGGVLLGGIDNAFGASAPLAVNSGTINLGGFSQAVGALSGSAGTLITTSTAAGSATLTTSIASGTSTFAGSIANNVSGTVAFTKTGAGTQVLSGNNSYTGATTVNAGILSISSTSGLAGTSGVTISGGAGLAYTGAAGTFAKNVTISAGSGTGTIRNSGGGLLTLSGNLSKDNSVLRFTGGAFNVTGLITGVTPGTSDLVVDNAFVTLSNTNTYNGPTYVFNSGTLSLGINNAIPNTSAVTLGDAASVGTLVMGTYTDSIAQLLFTGSGGTLSLSGDKTASAQLATNGSLTLGSNASLVLTSPGTSAGLYRLISYTSLSGSFSPSNVTGVPTGYSLLYTGTEVDLQQNAIFGTISVTNPAAIITGGSAAFSYTVSNAAFSGGATLSFSGSGASNVAGTSSGSAAAAGTSTSVSGLFFNGTTVGSGQQGTFTVNAPSGYGSTTATGTVSVNVYDHAAGSLSGGTIRVADSIVGYSGTLAGLTTASVGNAAGYRVNLKTLGTTSAGGVSINNVSGITAGGSSTISAAVVTGTSFGANAVNQQFTLTYADDSALAGALSSGLGSGTVTVQGNVYDHASGSANGTTIALADSIVGYTGSLSGLTSATISNAAGYRVNLMTTGGTSAGFVNINNVSGIAAGSSATISAAAVLSGSQSVGSNALGQTFTLTYGDDSTLLGKSSNLGNQSITVTGNVYDHASGSLSGGTIRVADSIVGYSGTLAGLTTASVGNAAGYRVNLKTLGTTSAGGVSINNVSGVVAGGSSTISAAVVTGTGFGANAVNQQFTLTYADDSTLAGASSNLGSGTVTVQGNVYGHASGSATGATIALADSIVGYTGSLSGLTSATISNAAGYRVNLMTTGGTSAGFVNISNVSGVAAGSSGQISAAAGLDGSQTVGANSLGQTFNLTYADDSNLNGASNNLGGQSITVTGRVLDHATSSLGASLLTSTTVSLGTYNYSTNTWESGGATGFFDIYNLASAFSASLTADLSLVNAIGAGNGFTTNLLSTYADIAGNGSQRFSIFFDPSGAQANRSTTFTISMSDKTGMAGATASNTLFVTANVIVVPEPGAIALAGVGVAIAGWMACKRQRSLRQ